MRARHRHFNARFAGASGVYDARFISGLANNATVGTWSSRTGTNDATQSTEANKPVYKTNQFNGNPVVEFDGSNDNLAFAEFNGSQAWALCVVKRTSTNTYQNILALDSTGVGSTLAISVHNDSTYGPVIWGSGNNGSTVQWAKGSSLRNDAWRSLYLVWLGGGTNGSANYRGWDDGVAITRDNSGNIGSTSDTNSRIGNTSNSWGGQMALIVFSLDASTDPLRKRVSHAAAYSFKLASS